MPRDTELDETNCAKFRVTYVRPGDLNLLEDGDDRLEWRCVPIAGGEATFFGPTDGRKVKLHGVTRGEVGLELRFRGVLVAVYRALVLPLVRIPSRITILYGDPANVALRPQTTPGQAAMDLRRTNKYWWQAGIQFYLSRSRTIGYLPAGVAAANVRNTRVRGVFEADVPAGLTRGVSASAADPAALNARQWVANFNYVKSCSSATTVGAQIGNEAQVSASITDRGTPSTSWKRPTGVPPDPASGSIWMTVLGGAVTPIAGQRNLFTMFICDNNRNRME